MLNQLEVPIDVITGNFIVPLWENGHMAARMDQEELDVFPQSELVKNTQVAAELVDHLIKLDLQSDDLFDAMRQPYLKGMDGGPIVSSYVAVISHKFRFPVYLVEWRGHEYSLPCLASASALCDVLGMITVGNEDAPSWPK